MAQGNRGFSLVDDPQEFPDLSPAPAAPRREPLIDRASVDMLKVALGALSQAFVVAVARLFMLASVASVFVLWYLTPDPNQNQIVAMTIYASFILIINYLAMRRK